MAALPERRWAWLKALTSSPGKEICFDEMSQTKETITKSIARLVRAQPPFPLGNDLPQLPKHLPPRPNKPHHSIHTSRRADRQPILVLAPTFTVDVVFSIDISYFTLFHTTLLYITFPPPDHFDVEGSGPLLIWSLEVLI
jgi:hypothetical protein